MVWVVIDKPHLVKFQLKSNTMKTVDKIYIRTHGYSSKPSTLFPTKRRKLMFRFSSKTKTIIGLDGRELSYRMKSIERKLWGQKRAICRCF